MLRSTLTMDSLPPMATNKSMILLVKSGLCYVRCKKAVYHTTAYMRKTGNV